MRTRPQKPKGAPEGTVWFGGPIDRCRVSLRVFGDDLDPGTVTDLLLCPPTHSEKKGVAVRNSRGLTRIPKRGCWMLIVDSGEAGEWDVEEVISALLAKLPAELGVWRLLNRNYKVDLYCGLFMAAANRGFGLSPSLTRKLAERELETGFDIYCPEK